jgi:hypothetical protein
LKKSGEVVMSRREDRSNSPRKGGVKVRREVLDDEADQGVNGQAPKEGNQASPQARLSPFIGGESTWSSPLLFVVLFFSPPNW